MLVLGRGAVSYERSTPVTSKVTRFKNGWGPLLACKNTPGTRNKPETRNLKPKTRNLKPETRNPKPETRNPKSETRNANADMRAVHTQKVEVLTLFRQQNAWLVCSIGITCGIPWSS